MDANINSAAVREFATVHKRLRQQQLSVGLFGSLSAVPYILIAAGVIPAYFYVWFIPFIFETSANFGVMLSNYQSIICGGKNQSSKTGISSQPANSGSKDKRGQFMEGVDSQRFISSRTAAQITAYQIESVATDIERESSIQH